MLPKSLVVVPFIMFYVFFPLRQVIETDDPESDTTRKNWDALAGLVQPGMTTDQLLTVLPPQRKRPANGALGAPIMTLWNGQTFFMQYPLDDDFYVNASGFRNVLSCRPNICKRQVP